MLRESQPLTPSGDSPTNDLDFCKEFRVSLFRRQLEAEYTWRKEERQNGFDLISVTHSCQVCHKTCRIYLGVLLSEHPEIRWRLLTW